MLTEKISDRKNVINLLFLFLLFRFYKNLKKYYD